MSVINSKPGVDSRKVMHGNNGALYDQKGNLMASVEGFHSQASITSQTFRPLGTNGQEISIPVGYKITLTFTEVVVESGLFLKEIIEGLRTGRMPMYNFRGMMRSPYDGSEEQVVYRDCVPDGNIDIQNVAVGELYKRVWNFVCNQPPDAQSYIKNT